MAHTGTTWTPKTWTDTHHPAPDVPVLNGLRFDQYEQQCYGTKELLGDDQGHGPDDLALGPSHDKAIISDPHTGRYIVVTGGFGQCPRMWLCEGETVTMTAHPFTWVWDLHKTAAFELTWLAFRDARRAGTLEQYWAS